MIVFPNCKINLGLNVLRKRNDGYHDIETVLLPVPLEDALEAIQTDGSHGNLEFSTSGEKMEADPKENLCSKVHQLLKNDFPQLPAVKMHLHKSIPAGAGLGGGSADAAFALKLFNKLFNLRLTIDQLLDYALRIGSDCPFFIINKPCFASGRGEFLERISLDLSKYKFVIVNPGIHISTTEAFSWVVTKLHAKSIKEIIEQPVESWKGELINDFEEPVFRTFPEIAMIKNKLYQHDAVYASMTGSGSTVYGIFQKNNLLQISFPANYFVKELNGQLQ